MLILIYITILYETVGVMAYSNKLFTVTQESSTRHVDICLTKNMNHTFNGQNVSFLGVFYEKTDKVTSPWEPNVITESEFEIDPYLSFRKVFYKFLFGDNYTGPKITINDKQNKSEAGNLLHFPTGRALRKSELFNGKIGVHVPIAELLHRGNCLLNVTDDYMQTAVDAFAIFIKGDLADVKRLPAEYVLNSARTISMLKISYEKLSATWNVVTGSRNPVHVTYETLEKYRPLFKYLSGKDMAMLNLTDRRILNFIGTHPDLNRHQVGLVASKYIKMNKRWSQAKYLNLMNNLLCGVPITYMREIHENTYLQLSHQVFYHTRACDPLQRRFYLGMMTRTQVSIMLGISDDIPVGNNLYGKFMCVPAIFTNVQLTSESALGKSYSWNAQDVARLGLLMAEVEGEDLGAIKPEALAGLTAQVVTAMRPENLQHLTDVQLRYVGEKPYNILSNKLKMYKEQILSTAVKNMPVFCIVLLNIIIKSVTHTLNTYFAS